MPKAKVKSRILVWPVFLRNQIPEEWMYGKGTTAVVSTVSHSAKAWERGLSPFIAGPCKLWGRHESVNMENSWQFSKVYHSHLEEDGKVGKKWIEWACKGWATRKAIRYPMGKGKKPLFSFWDGERLDYIAARRRIYGPLYREAVIDTDAYDKLMDIHNKADRLVLLDYDAYDHHKLKMSLSDVLNNPNKKMGHAFVLAMMLEDDKALNELAL